MSVELAAALPAVALVVGMVMVAVAWAGDGVAAADAAALGSRIAAVEGEPAAREAIAQALPGATVQVAHAADGAAVTVVVSLESVPWLPAPRARSTALVTS
ncbi:hypothetical protein [Demequina sp.]|uniref:hypothetical protein n=1 Tax=Demequina sp. TaxID=2050685 RepID=UPI003A8478A0